MKSSTLTEEVRDGFRGIRSGILKAGPAAWILILLFAALYWEPTRFVWRVWTRENGYYSHGPLVPFISAWMLLRRQRELEKVPVRPNWWGLVILVLCSLGFLASTLCHMYPPKYFLFVFYVLGFNLLFFGFEMVRATFVPWAFLFFMVPFPDAVIDLFTYKLRLFVTAQAVHLTEPFNWYIVKSGNRILFPTGEWLVVEDVCAGLRSLISLLALGAIFGYISSLNTCGRILLFVLSAPVAVVTNILRIFALIVVGHFAGTEVASGTVHEVSGYAIFVVAFILLYILNRLLEYVFPGSDSQSSTAEEPG